MSENESVERFQIQPALGEIVYLDAGIQRVVDRIERSALHAPKVGNAAARVINEIAVSPLHGAGAAALRGVPNVACAVQY